MQTTPRPTRPPIRTTEAGETVAAWCASLVAGRAPGPLGAVSRSVALEVLGSRGVAGLAWAAVQRGDALVDDVTAAQLESTYAFQAVQGGEFLEAARGLRSTLAGAGIPSLVFKGAAMIRRGFWTSGERRLSDIDLLVHPEDAQYAVELLSRQGMVPWVPWDSDRLGWASAFTLSRPSSTPALTVTVDLHWSSLYGRLRTRPTNEPDPLWDRADLEAGLPSDEAQFVMTADHVFKHLHFMTHVAGVADLVCLLPHLTNADALLEDARRRRIEHRIPRLMDVLHQALSLPEAAFDSLPAALRPTHRSIPAEMSHDSRLFLDLAERERGNGLRLRWSMGVNPARDLADTLWPEGAWLRARYGSMGFDLTRRARHVARMVAWLVGRGVSPLAPNQGFE